LNVKYKRLIINLIIKRLYFYHFSKYPKVEAITPPINPTVTPAAATSANKGAKPLKKWVVENQ
jgi:hypothetical protein